MSASPMALARGRAAPQGWALAALSAQAVKALWFPCPGGFLWPQEHSYTCGVDEDLMASSD